MFVITILGREAETIYYAINEKKEEVIYFFEEEDDAIRFSLMREEDGSPDTRRRAPRAESIPPPRQ